MQPSTPPDEQTVPSGMSAGCGSVPAGATCASHSGSPNVGPAPCCSEGAPSQRKPSTQPTTRPWPNGSSGGTRGPISSTSSRALRTSSSATLTEVNARVSPPISRREAARVHDSDRRLWPLLLRLEHANRWWQHNVRRRPFEFLIPERMTYDETLHGPRPKDHRHRRAASITRRFRWAPPRPGRPLSPSRAMAHSAKRRERRSA